MKDTCVNMSPKELYESVKIDELYFWATNGGVMFGGGEPLLYTDFIIDFHKTCEKKVEHYT
ncbi:MAG: hypothetical protein E7270_09145 [Lachnospiraceae bacterium]|nr:hypothetical protein [Lachnospiraceae bacterium]